jgi:hypothetical protein
MTHRNQMKQMSTPSLKMKQSQKKSTKNISISCRIHPNKALEEFSQEKDKARNYKHS